MKMRKRKWRQRYLWFLRQNRCGAVSEHEEDLMEKPYILNILYIVHRSSYSANCIQNETLYIYQTEKLTGLRVSG